METITRRIKRPLTRRVFLYIATLIVLSNMILCLMTAMVFRNNIEKQATASGISLLKRNLESVNSFLKGIDNIANSLLYNQDLIELLKRKELTAADVKALDSIFSIFYQSRNDLKLAVYKETDPSKVYSIYSGTGLVEEKDFHQSEWYQKLERSGKNRVMVTHQTSVYSDGGTEDYAHAMVYRIYDSYGDSCVGYLRIDIDLQSLNQEFTGDYENIDGISIYDESGGLMFQEKMQVGIPKETTEEDGAVSVYQDNDFIIVYGDVFDIGWKMAFCMDKGKLFEGVNDILFILAAVSALIILVTAACTQKLCSIVTENFRCLVDGMEQVKLGRLDTQVETVQDDEISVLIEEFNGTVRQLNVLMEEVEKKQLLLKQAEIRALQQQINPHFIFNSLETIMGLASEGMDDKIITVCEGMSSMLRYNISFQNKTSLKNEIAQMKNYTKIMQVRFENRFEVYYDIDEQCLNAEFVKFTLQPLVENAISHGLSQCVSGGMIRIRIQKEEGMVAISIFDNGSGIDPERLKEINKGIRDAIENPLEYVDSYSGLGLMNTNLRLRLHFKEGYHIEIFSKEKRGTCIYIKIPYIEV